MSSRALRRAQRDQERENALVDPESSEESDHNAGARATVPSFSLLGSNDDEDESDGYGGDEEKMADEEKDSELYVVSCSIHAIVPNKLTTAAQKSSRKTMACKEALQQRPRRTRRPLGAKRKRRNRNPPARPGWCMMIVKSKRQ